MGEHVADVVADLAHRAGHGGEVRFPRQQGVLEAQGDEAADDLADGHVPGVEIAASLYHQEDLTQSSLGIVPIGGTLGTAHAVVSQGPFSIKTLYARWHLTGGSDTVNPANGAVSGSDVQYGWYVEPAFKITKQWGVFARYSEWDNRAGNANASDTLKRQTDVGVNYWPHPQVVVKFDVQNQEGASNDDGFNLGIGYMF